LWLTRKFGANEELVELPDNSPLYALLEKISESKSENIKKLIQEIIQGKSEIIILLNSKTPPNGLKTILRDGDEVDLMPPVSGGSNLNPSKLSN
jgi:molybdopterin synthase sulfur carrier subunit